MISLNDGNKVPLLGLTSFRKESNEDTVEVVKLMLRAGVRHFEIAGIIQIYVRSDLYFVV